MFCFCFLAYGEEHIKEFNIVAKSILKLNSNCSDKILVAMGTMCVYNFTSLDFQIVLQDYSNFYSLENNLY